MNFRTFLFGNELTLSNSLRNLIKTLSSFRHFENVEMFFLASFRLHKEKADELGVCRRPQRKFFMKILRFS